MYPSINLTLIRFAYLLDHFVTSEVICILLIAIQTNSHQGIVITDGTDSFAVFTYQCGAMTWSGNATIGFNAGGSQFENHPLSGSSMTQSIGCMNYNSTVWTNLLFKLTPNSKLHSYFL